MKRFTRIVVAFALIALMAVPALAQRRPRRGGGGGMSGFMLLSQKSVQEDLKLSDDQVKQLKEAGEKMQKEFAGLRDLSREERGKKFEELRKEGDKTVAKVLDKKQAKRLKQIGLQLQGSMAYGNPEVAKALGLTDDQKKQIADIQKETREEMGKIFQGEGTREEKRAKMTELRKSAKEKTEKVLTADQKTKWKELAGEKFTGKIEFNFGRGRGRGRNR
jgi:Spy/CpxP family protein refolding chaperone